MHIYIELGVMLLAFMSAWMGLALAKASQQREESERASLHSASSPRVVQASAHRSRPAKVHDLSSMGRALASARDSQRTKRPLWGYDAADRAATRSEVGVGPEAA